MRKRNSLVLSFRDVCLAYSVYIQRDPPAQLHGLHGFVLHVFFKFLLFYLGSRVPIYAY